MEHLAAWLSRRRNARRSFFSDRADRLITHLRALDGNIALFSHGQFGCVLAARWIGLAPIEAQHFAIGPASLSILGHKPSHPDVPIIALWNAARASLDVTQKTSVRFSDRRSMTIARIKR